MSDTLNIENTFRQNEIYESYLGKVVRVKQQAGENEDNKRLYVDLELGIGGTLNNVGYYGGGVDLNTGYPHGLFVPPRIGQVILVLFLRGSSQVPVGCCPFPHPNWDLNKTGSDKFNDIMDDLDDITLFHFSGSRIHLRKDGKIEITKKISGTEHKVEIEITASKVVIDYPSATTVEFGKGATEKFVKGDLFKTLFNAHTHPTPAGPSSPSTQQMSGTQLSSKNKTI